MTYVIVKDRQTIIGSPHPTFAALNQASERFGDCAKSWMNLNLRVEENRPLCDGMHIA